MASSKKSSSAADKIPYVYILMGGNAQIVGEEMEKNERVVLLRYPAVVRRNQTGTGWSFEPIQLVEPGSPFWLVRASLFGYHMMPKVMMSDYAAYLKAMEATAVAAAK